MYPINSFHHQSVKDLGEGLEIIGYDAAYRGCMSTRNDNYKRLHPIYTVNKKGETVPLGIKDGKPTHWHSIVEAYRSTEEATHNVLCFQYHPEEFNCEFAVTMIDATLEAACNGVSVVVVCFRQIVLAAVV